MLFLVTCVSDEGVYDSATFIVVEAESKLEIAQHMLTHPSRWQRFLNSAYPSRWLRQSNIEGTLMDCIGANPQITPEEFLELIEMTCVDGDSWAQLRIHPVTMKQLDEVDTNYW